jgi:hypothetical protein
MTGSGRSGIPTHREVEMAACGDIPAARSATLMNPQLSARRTNWFDQDPEPDPLSPLQSFRSSRRSLGTIWAR